MIKQAAVGLNSSYEINILDEKGMLPLLTNPDSTILNYGNIPDFLENKINVCFPGKVEDFTSLNLMSSFISITLDKLNELTTIRNKHLILNSSFPVRVSINDTSGNMPELHYSIIKAKEFFKEKIVIMAGDALSVNTFSKLVKIGCDYIRVGYSDNKIESSKNTFTTINDLAELINICYIEKKTESTRGAPYWSLEQTINYQNKYKNVKIVANGTSNYIENLYKKNLSLNNGYGALINLLYNGADYIIVNEVLNQSANNCYNFLSSWTLQEWINGKPEWKDNLPGFKNSLELSMKHYGVNSLKDFKIK